VATKKPGIDDGEDVEPAATELHPVEAVKVRGERRLNFRSWLWLQHNENTKFAPLARLVLSGGPESVWMNKPLRAEFVCTDVEMFFASGRPGVRSVHVDLAREAVPVYLDDERTVNELVTDKKGKVARREIEKVVTDSATDRLGSELEPAIDTRGTARVMPTASGTMLPRVRCTYFRPKNDTQCVRMAVQGSVRCDIHGGEYLDPEETKAILRAGQERLVMASSDAIDSLMDLMQNSVNDAVRLKAVEMVLDRTGFKPGMEVTLSGQTEAGISPAEVLRTRLERLGSVADGPVVDQAGQSVEPPTPAKELGNGNS
jgi:hypothetical protein